MSGLERYDGRVRGGHPAQLDLVAEPLRARGGQEEHASQNDALAGHARAAPALPTSSPPPPIPHPHRSRIPAYKGP